MIRESNINTLINLYIRYLKYLIFLFNESSCICILKLPNVIIIVIIRPCKNLFEVDIEIRYIPLENSINPNIKLSIIGFISINVLAILIITEKNNMFAKIIDNDIIVFFSEFEYIDKKFIFKIIQQSIL